jgi:hypothetical protein
MGEECAGADEDLLLNNGKVEKNEEGDTPGCCHSFGCPSKDAQTTNKDCSIKPK